MEPAGDEDKICVLSNGRRSSSSNNNSSNSSSKAINKNVKKRVENDLLD